MDDYEEWWENKMIDGWLNDPHKLAEEAYRAGYDAGANAGYENALTDYGIGDA